MAQKLRSLRCGKSSRTCRLGGTNDEESRSNRIDARGPFTVSSRPRGKLVYGQTSRRCVRGTRFTAPIGETAFLPRAGVDGALLIELMRLTKKDFSWRYKGSAVKRTDRRGLLRDLAVALGTGY